MAESSPIIFAHNFLLKKGHMRTKLLFLVSLFSYSCSGADIHQVSLARIAEYKRSFARSSDRYALARIGVAGIGLAAYLYGIADRLAVGALPLTMPLGVSLNEDGTISQPSFLKKLATFALNAATAGITGMILNKYLNFVVTPLRVSRAAGYTAELNEHVIKINTLILLCTVDPEDYVEFGQSVLSRVQETVCLVEKIIATASAQGEDEEESAESKERELAISQLIRRTDAMSRSVCDLVKKQDFKTLGTLFSKYMQEFTYLMKLIQ